MASKAGQILQAELLAVYGADPGTQDSSGKTPVDYARWETQLFYLSLFGIIYLVYDSLLII